MNKTEKNENQTERPPVVVVMGHIDHGKSTLLDYIRKTNVVEKEAGGITQHISAYEVVHKDEHGKNKKITFIDTPGHEAFSKMRERGAMLADIAILIVSAEDGVKPQTVEAWKTICENDIPCLVAINKIDKPTANVEKTKMELAENEIYLEKYGGKVPYAEISAKTGTGVDNLLVLLLILAEVENLKANSKKEASGFVIEANLDPRRGIQTTLLIKDGILKKGMLVAAGEAVCSTKIIENFLGEAIEEASFSSPVRLIGFSEIPAVGSFFTSFKNKKEAEKYCLFNKKSDSGGGKIINGEENLDKKIIPVVLKADTSGSLEAIEKEIKEIKKENTEFRVIQKGVGILAESDVKAVALCSDTLIVGFNIKADRSALELAEKRGIVVGFFNIIYKLSEWLAEEMEKRRSKIETAEILGRAKILKAFSRTKERQILGGKVLEGEITVGNKVKILRRDFEIGNGQIANLEKNREKISTVEKDSEFGLLLESKIEAMAGDVIESFALTKNNLWKKEKTERPI